MSDYTAFIPAIGTEEKILSQNPKEGYLYFATDTKKIFYGDFKNRSFIPMGGNFGLYYGKMVHSETPDKGQVEFDFTYDDLEEIEKITAQIAPGDLILNIPDGSFYRVVELEDEKIATERITISGSGDGSSSGNANIGTMTYERIGNQNISTLYQTECKIGFTVSAVDASGESTGDGTVRVEIDGIPVPELSGKAFQNRENWIDVGPHLTTIGDVEVKVYVSMDVGGSSRVTQSKKWYIKVSSCELTWEDNKEYELNNVHNNFTLKWNITGSGIKKRTRIIVDDFYEVLDQTGTDEEWEHTIIASNLIDFNLVHGVHKFKMEVSIEVAGDTIPFEPIYKDLIFIDESNNTPIISCPLHGKKYKQYNTIELPIIVYSSSNDLNGGNVYLLEEDVSKGEILGAKNGVLYVLNYTPLNFGTIILSLRYEGIMLTFSIDVEDIGAEISEVANYAFKFKSSEFANNLAVQNWNSNGVKAIFSNNFDWINGGLITSERDEFNNPRPFVRVKAGTSMTIDYKLFNITAKRGKSFKCIFKTTNCRDYDAQALACKTDRKIIQTYKEEGEEIYLDIEENALIPCSTLIKISEDQKSYSLLNETVEIFNMNDENSRKKFKDKYILFKEKIYLCTFKEMEKENQEDPTEYYAIFYETALQDSFEGLLIQAQQATFNSQSNFINTQYCEDTYIELSLDIAEQDDNDIKNYIKFWVDGVPSTYVIYDSLDSFLGAKDSQIIIGSKDCDVDIYLMKAYEKSLSDDQHLNNFIADTIGAEEMIARYNRNNILNEDTKIIDYKLVAKNNPECLVHVYDIPHIPTSKKDETYPCKYEQYQGGGSVKYYAENVMIKVQGTSSERYVVAAANLDTDFKYKKNGNVPSGLIDGETKEVLTNGWSMDENAIPVNYTCTKVNVASCENANNAINQWWYNAFQPYKSVLRCKNPKARDTMQFKNGVLFMIDRNPVYNLASDHEKSFNNIFGEIKGYVSSDMSKSAHARFYSIANMGNSKDNIEVFHDTENPLECCIEVKDNQNPCQWMVDCDNYTKHDIGEGSDIFEFRYPKKSPNASQDMINGWNRLVTWMAHSNPQPKYEKYDKIYNQSDYKKFAYNYVQKKWKNVFIYDDDLQEYTLIEGFDPKYDTYYLETDHIYGYTNKPLPDYIITNDYLPEKDKIYYIKDSSENYVSYDAYANGFYFEDGINKTYEPVQKTFSNYKFTGFIAENQKNPDTNKSWQSEAGYEPIVKSFDPITKYANTYTHDTYEYRMAKMLNECEKYLIMDSILYHYLFIERHCMIDNVAKNTFWSTEDCLHWSLIKDYDNDTADGNDNNGKFTRTYGMETTDKYNKNSYVFNARQSVWLAFAQGLEEALEQMYIETSKFKTTYKNKTLSLWSAEDYLWMFKDWQSIIPERCWIEDYYRKYFRPYELYKISMYNSMMEGGQKTHQRKQFETYQKKYIESKYNGPDNLSKLWFRPVGEGMKDHELETQVYSDCYIRMDIGQIVDKQRAKRNVPISLKCPVNNLNNATMDIRPASLFTIIGSPTGGQINDFTPDQVDFSAAGKLRKMYYATSDNAKENDGLTEGFSVVSPNLEELYACNMTAFEDRLDLRGNPSLLKLDATNSAFTVVSIANNAPVEDIILQQPTALEMNNLYNLKTLSIKDYTKLKVLDLNNIDNNTVNSKSDILDHCIENLTNYRLTDVKWTMSLPTEIDDMNKKIILLERLLNEKHPLEDKDTESGYKPIQQALTGSLNITEDAYNNEDSVDLYNKYIIKDKYPALDINFIGNKAKLFTVTILDGNGDIFWKKRIKANEDINEEFLSDGPYGIFDVSKIKKSSTLDTYYDFDNRWKIVYETSGIKEDLDSRLPIISNINDNIILEPQFIGNILSYKYVFYQGSEILLQGTAPYGTLITDILPNKVPYKIDNTLQLYETYGFKGYSLSPTSKSVVPKTYKIIADTNFYAVFSSKDDGDEAMNVYNNILDEYYLTLTSENKVKVKSGYHLTGKITLPRIVNGKTVTGIANDGFKYQGITHLFWQPLKDKENITSFITVEAGAFSENKTLQYYEITDDLSEIGKSAFYKVGFTTEMMTIKGKSLTKIGDQSFQEAFYSYVAKNKANTVNLVLGGNITSIGYNAFAYNWSVIDGRTYTIQIGDQQIPWVEDISTINLGSNIFHESQDSYSTFIFTIYSNIGLANWLETNQNRFEQITGIKNTSHIDYD